MGTRTVARWTMALGAMLALLLAGSAGAQMTGTPTGGPHGGMMGTPGQGGPMMGSTGNGVVYLTITNNGKEDDALLSGTTDRAERVEAHQMVVENQVASMRPVEGPLPIPAGEAVTLEPGGLHLMLVNLTEDNRPGDTFELTLTFEKAGDVSVEVPVRLGPEPTAGEPESTSVTAGDLVIEGAWSRPAPRLSTSGATPAATPAS